MTTFARRPVLTTNIATLLIGSAMISTFVLVPQLAQLPGGRRDRLRPVGHPGRPAARARAACSRSCSRRSSAASASATAPSRRSSPAAPSSPSRCWAWRSPTAPSPLVILWACLVSAGVGAVFAAIPNLIVNAVDAHETGEATGVNTIMRNVGSLGVLLIPAAAPRRRRTSSRRPRKPRPPTRTGGVSRTPSDGDTCKHAGMTRDCTPRGRRAACGSSTRCCTVRREPRRARRALGLSRATITALLHDLECAGHDLPAARGREGAPGGHRPPAVAGLARGRRGVRGRGGPRPPPRARRRLRPRAAAPSRRATPPLPIDEAPGGFLDLAAELTRDALRRARVDAPKVLGVGVGLAAPIDAANGRIHAAGILAALADGRRRGRAPAAAGTARARRQRRQRGRDGRVPVRRGARGRAPGLRAAVGRRRARADPRRPALPRRLRGRRRARPRRRRARRAAVPLRRARLSGAGREPASRSPAWWSAAAASRSASSGCSSWCATAIAAPAAPSPTRADAVGETIATTVNLLNPQRVIVGGELAQAGDVLLDPIRDAVARHVARARREAVAIVAARARRPRRGARGRGGPARARTAGARRAAWRSWSRRRPARRGGPKRAAPCTDHGWRRSTA